MEQRVGREGDARSTVFAGAESRRRPSVPETESEISQLDDVLIKCDILHMYAGSYV